MGVSPTGVATGLVCTQLPAALIPPTASWFSSAMSWDADEGSSL